MSSPWMVKRQALFRAITLCCPELKTLGEVELFLREVEELYKEHIRKKTAALWEALSPEDRKKILRESEEGEKKD